MKPRGRTALLAALAALLLLAPVRAQSVDYSPQLVVEGLVTAPRVYDVEALRRLPQTEVWIQHVTEPVPRQFRGVTLYDLVMDAEPRFELDRPSEPLSWYVVISATDERSAVVSWGEIHPWFEEKPVVVAYERDGQPLPPAQGMARLVVPFDRQAARGIANIRTISLQRARTTAAAGE